jgi:type IV pilus assembly protein PilY1
MKLHSRLLLTAFGILASVASQPTLADDSEVFTSSSFTVGAGVRPNVLFVIDTSGSMNSDVILYDPTVTYTGSCDSASIYWVQQNDPDSAPPATCDDNNRLSATANRCRAAWLGMQQDGWWNGRTQQLNGSASSWQNLAANRPDRKVECSSDAGNHGDVDANLTDSGSNTYARNGSGSNRWGVWWDSAVDWRFKARYSLYSGNYINWYTSGGSGTIKTRLQIVQEVSTNLINTLQGVNLGLMRYDRDANGGMVTYAMSELTDTTRQEMVDLVKGYGPAGNTPLSETYYESFLYLSGGAVDYGNRSEDEDGEFLSVPASREGGAADGANYDSPMDFSCQKTFIVYLTDGLPTSDDGASDEIEALEDFDTDGFVTAADGGGGAVCPTDGPSGNANGRCMVNLAKYLANHDMRDDVIGDQTANTYVIGFGSDIATSKAYLENIAKAGNGKAYTQGDSAGLTAALEEIFSDVAQNANSTFVSPTVAVNAFNRTRNLNTLFVSVFAPTNRAHWPGNVKKYQFIDGAIHGTSTTTPAVNPTTGFFRDGTRDLFNASATADGPDVTKGGTASNLPDHGAREVFTYFGTDATLTSNANEFTDSNASLTNTKIGLDATATAAERTDVIEFTRGRDVNDDNNDQAFTDTRQAMGDPMHSRPAVAIYGGTETSPSGVVYATTNDGMLHAFNMSDGTELWSFIPEEMLGRLAALQKNRTTVGHSYGVDGDVRIFKYDVNDNGTIDSGDKMYLVFGFGRGGSAYYALDVTNRAAPVVLWRKTAAELPMLGQAWSAPVITRVNVNSSSQTDPQKFVVIFGAGYDTTQENYTYADDGVGNGIYMLELATGNQLWSAGKTGTTGVDWSHDRMLNSIPADINVLDLNGDGYADRMYAGDMGGRIWRFDIWHGQAPADLVSGGLFAALGAGELSTPTATAARPDARRFYYAPDVSFVTPRGSAPYLNIAIGSGYRGHPLETETQDRFYSLRDYAPFVRRIDSSYDAPGWTPISDASLVNVTTNVNTAVPGGSTGWKLDLNLNGWRGEKVLAESVTADGVIFFPTFTPTGVDPRNPCLATTLNRSYAVYVDSARPYGIQDSTLPPGDPRRTDDPYDRFDTLVQGGIAPGTAIIQTPDDKTICLNGVEAKKCVSIGDVTRTFWERRQ